MIRIPYIQLFFYSRDRHCSAACRLASAAGLRDAATAEFLLSALALYGKIIKWQRLALEPIRRVSA